MTCCDAVAPQACAESRAAQGTDHAPADEQIMKEAWSK